MATATKVEFVVIDGDKLSTKGGWKPRTQAQWEWLRERGVNVAWDGPAMIAAEMKAAGLQWLKEHPEHNGSPEPAPPDDAIFTEGLATLFLGAWPSLGALHREVYIFVPRADVPELAEQVDPEDCYRDKDGEALIALGLAFIVSDPNPQSMCDHTYDQREWYSQAEAVRLTIQLRDTQLDIQFSKNGQSRVRQQERKHRELEKKVNALLGETT
jgi:hypothetical protein